MKRTHNKTRLLLNRETVKQLSKLPAELAPGELRAAVAGDGNTLPPTACLHCKTL